MPAPRPARWGRVVWVWVARPDAPASSEALLTFSERERCSSLARPVDRAQLRSAHVLARLAVAARLGLDLAQVSLGATCARCGGAHGRPEVRAPAGSGLHLSLSHAGDQVVVAMARVPVGVDVEPVGAAPLPVAAVALSPKEQTALDRLPTAEQGHALTSWWVRKEAVLKAAGVGLTVDPRTVALTAAGPASARIRAPGAARRYQVADLQVGEAHVAAVALAGRRPPRPVVRAVDLSSMG